MSTNAFLKWQIQMRGNKQNVKDTGYNINNVLEGITPYSQFYQFKFKNVPQMCILLKNSFGTNIFDRLVSITGADMFSNKYFPVILDNKYEFILMSINSIVIDESDKVLCSKNLIKNVMAIICSQIQNNNDNFIKYYRIPFFKLIIHDFLFILAIMFIMLSNFNIEHYTLENCIHTKKYKDDVDVDFNELNMLLQYENFFNIVNKYHIIKNCTGFVYTNAIRFINGPIMDGFNLGSGRSDKARRRKNMLDIVCNYTVLPRPPRKSDYSSSLTIRNSNSASNSASNSNSASESESESEEEVEAEVVEEAEEVEAEEVEAEIVPESTEEPDINFIENFGATLLKNSIEMCESMRIEIPIDPPNNNSDNSDTKRKTPDYNDHDDIVETLLSMKIVKNA